MFYGIVCIHIYNLIAIITQCTWYLHVLFDMSTLVRRPPQLMDKNNDVDVDGVDVYVRLENDDHGLFVPNGTGQSSNGETMPISRN